MDRLPKELHDACKKATQKTGMIYCGIQVKDLSRDDLIVALWHSSMHYEARIANLKKALEI